MTKKPTITVYTSAAGTRDSVRSDIVCFPPHSDYTRPVMQAKVYKQLAHHFVQAEVSVWLDANIFLLIDPQKLVDEMLGDADIGVFCHPDRDCIYDELQAIRFFKRDAPRTQEQVSHYLQLGWPKHAGLYNTGVLLRRNNIKTQAFNCAWWAEMCRFSTRDQLSFPIILARFPQIKINKTKGRIEEHEWFKYINHKS